MAVQKRRKTDEFVHITVSDLDHEVDLYPMTFLVPRTEFERNVFEKGCQVGSDINIGSFKFHYTEDETTVFFNKHIKPMMDEKLFRDFERCPKMPYKIVAFWEFAFDY